MAEKPAFIKYKYNPVGQLKNSYLDVTLFFSEAPQNDNYGANNENNDGSNDNNKNNDNNNENNRFDGGDSSGGCNSGFISGIIALSLFSVLKKKR